MTFFEKQKGQTELPIIDNSISTKTALLLIVVPTVIFMALVYLSFQFPITNEFMNFITYSLSPFLALTGSLWLILGRQINELFKGRLTGNFLIWLLTFISIFIYNILIGHVMTFFHLPMANNLAVEQSVGNHSIIIEGINNFFGLFSEELFAIPVFIGFTALFFQTYKMNRDLSIYLGLLFSMILFGLAHFEAYSWHIWQMMLMIGALRFFITGLYIRTKNILIPFSLHYIYDMLLISLPIIFH
ncbi:CPBP family intramembrane metalloprotease [Weissella diestrammenae]|uniref:CPBP family intramembrane metalloprotease n=1 Tax=Weissella diestrammenae TaxID=1162633 RepID=A0A7G9T4S0_9LACO|nr:CPBP family glutamic-type intramembrane protease [Weissella diestrammenae]MCM0582806.1 CPBP family intramembrane metalloprotease [Weissella diestrammenae]QNN75095.1 CPBP family intramembrane metalloprotease [Weissella diestrammenae]